ncbi:MAG: type II toxin-antitoxin system VapC family toxin [Acetobacteraceae bacterium]|nr:type II toxin-antitoxin system VapC family toxin [Acetobacteraceae bacterium]
MIAAILVDTHLILWARIAPERLTIGERRALDDARLCYISAVSLWEIAILMALDRVARDQRLLGIPDGFDLLPVLPDHCRALVALPQRHRDPFDRMLIAQARAEHLALLTRDRAIIEYGAAGADVVTFGI